MRLFVAVNPPEGVRSNLWAATEPLRSADLPIRWVRPEGLHVTLKFLGDVPADRERAVVEAVQESVSDTRPFSLMIDGCGAFPSLERPRVVWVGCERSPPLELVQDRVERVLQPLGFPTEAKVFRPHVTIGRVRRGVKLGGRSVLGQLAADTAVQEEFVVTSIDLMASELARDGARYSTRHQAPLRTS